MAPANPELRELIKEMNRSKLAEQILKQSPESCSPEGEIFPSSVLPAIAMSKAGKERVFPMKWGFRQKSGLLINARIETAAEKPTFCESWAKHRCIIPASWYYEWDHDNLKKPLNKYVLKPVQTGPIWLAGLYRLENGFPAFVILTQPASDRLSWMHDRMPVLFPRNKIREWISPEINPETVIHNCLTDIEWKKAIKI